MCPDRDLLWSMVGKCLSSRTHIAWQMRSFCSSDDWERPRLERESFLLWSDVWFLQKVKAKILHISHELDLAVLSADGSFFRDMHPVKLSPQEPYLQDEVYVAGYPEVWRKSCLFVLCL
jgi:hypothetical protein